jgi:hypothetical protein
MSICANNPGAGADAALHRDDCCEPLRGAMSGTPAFVQNGHLDVLYANRLGYALFSEVFRDRAFRPTSAASSSWTLARPSSTSAGKASSTTSWRADPITSTSTVRNDSSKIRRSPSTLSPRVVEAAMPVEQRGVAHFTATGPRQAGWRKHSDGCCGRSLHDGINKLAPHWPRGVPRNDAREGVTKSSKSTGR